MPSRGDPSGRVFTSALPHAFSASWLFNDISLVEGKCFRVADDNICKEKLQLLDTHRRPDLPVIQVGTLCPVQGVRGDAATSCHAPGGGDNRHSRTLSQTVDHRMRQLRLLHRLLDLLQLLVVGSPHRGVCCCCCCRRCRREGARRCAS